MSKVRTRFAPSPTGYLHVGGARTVPLFLVICKTLTTVNLYYVLKIPT